jgi:hypothetical protein
MDKRSVLGVGLILGLLLPSLAMPAFATIVIQHSGATDPATEGFTTNVGNTPVYGSPIIGDLGYDAWHIAGPWSSSYNQNINLNANALTAENWTLTARMRNLSTSTGPQSGIYADVIINSHRYDIDLHSDGQGNEILSTNPFGPGIDYTIANLGANYALFKLSYDAGTQTVDYFVNNNLVISDSAGIIDFYASTVLFGGVDGNFNLVQLQTGVPESTTWAMILLGFAGLGFAGSRRAKALSFAGA